MALAKCQECGGQVSSLAAACPHCGAPIALITVPTISVQSEPVQSAHPDSIEQHLNYETLWDKHVLTTLPTLLVQSEPAQTDLDEADLYNETMWDLPKLYAILTRGISEGAIPDDIVKSIIESMEVFLNHRNDYFLLSPDTLQGPSKFAELTLKLGYWLAIRRLTPEGFRMLQAKIPPEHNLKWGVESPGSRPPLGAKLPDKALGPI